MCSVRAASVKGEVADVSSSGPLRRQFEWDGRNVSEVSHPVGVNGGGKSSGGSSRRRQRLLVAAIEAIFSLRGRRPKPTAEEFRKHVWSDNTRRMGIRFNEHLRDVWRNRWIRLHHPPKEQD